MANEGVPKRVQPAGDPPPTFRSLSLDEGAACGIATDGVAYCWGNSEFKYGRLGTGDTSSVSAIPRRVLGQP